jgi:hypothetical protein
MVKVATSYSPANLRAWSVCMCGSRDDGLNSIPHNRLHCVHMQFKRTAIPGEHKEIRSVLCNCVQNLSVRVRYSESKLPVCWLSLKWRSDVLR